MTQAPHAADGLTDRQRRELEYHREHSRKYETLLAEPLDYEVMLKPGLRWWNGYWMMYAYLCSLPLAGRCVLVVGCGFGQDAIRLAKLGARVSAFDLSPESIEIARALAAREGAEVDFRVAPAEKRISRTHDLTLFLRMTSCITWIFRRRSKKSCGWPSLERHFWSTRSIHTLSPKRFVVRTWCQWSSTPACAG